FPTRCKDKNATAALLFYGQLFADRRDGRLFVSFYEPSARTLVHANSRRFRSRSASRSGTLERRPHRPASFYGKDPGGIACGQRDNAGISSRTRRIRGSRGERSGLADEGGHW